MDYSPKL